MRNKQVPRHVEFNLHSEEMEPRQLLAGTPDPLFVFPTREATGVVAATRSALGATLTPETERIISMLDIVNPTEWSPLLKTMSPRHVVTIDKVFADGTATSSELKNLVGSIAYTQDISHAVATHVLANPIVLFDDDVDILSLTSLGVLNRSKLLQDRTNVVIPALNQASKSVKDLEVQLQLLRDEFGTTVTPEITSLENALQKLQATVQDLDDERWGLLRTRLVTGSVLPPNENLDEYDLRAESKLASIQLELESIRTNELSSFESLRTHGTLLARLTRESTEVVNDIESRESFAQGIEKPILNILLSQGRSCAVSIRDEVVRWQLAFGQLWENGSNTLSAAFRAELEATKKGVSLHLLAETISSDSLRISASSVMQMSGAVRLHETGTEVVLISLRGIYGYAPSITQSVDGAIQLGGRAGVLDLAGTIGKVVRIKIHVDAPSAAETPIVVTFIRNNQELANVAVTASGDASWESSDGITGVFVQNGIDLMSPVARQYFEYRANYTPRTLYPWQDPGPEYRFFTEVHPELWDVRGEIVAEADRGDMPLPTTVTGFVITSDMDVPTKDTEFLSTESSMLFSVLSSDRINTVILPENFWAKPISYDPLSYNAVSLRKFRGSPYIQAIGFQSPNGNFYSLPEELITKIGDTWIIHPTGRDMQLAVSVRDGVAYRNYFNVGQVFDCEVLQKNAHDLMDTLAPNQPLLESEEIRLFTINQGGSLGWHDGKWLENDTTSPVAVGTIKARMRLTNKGLQGVSFTVRTFSGYAGTPGWSVPQGEYPGSLGPNESRLLTDDIFMYTGSNGGSYVRFQVRDQNGRLLAEGGRPVGSSSIPADEQAMRVNRFLDGWEDAMRLAQQRTREYFDSLELPAPSMGDPATIVADAHIPDVPAPPDPAIQEQLLRIASRILQAERANGDALRIASAQRVFDDALKGFIGLTGQIAAIPSTVAAVSPDILLEDEGMGGNDPKSVLIARLGSDEYSLYRGETVVQNLLVGDVTLQVGTNAGTLFKQHRDSIISTANSLFHANGRSADEAALAVEWIQQNINELQFFLNALHPLHAADLMLSLFATGKYDIPDSNGAVLRDLVPLQQISDEGAGLTSVKALLNSQSIFPRSDTFVGRLFTWIVHKIDSAQTFDDVFTATKLLEKFTDIPWARTAIAWKIQGDSFRRHQSLKSLFDQAGFKTSFGTNVLPVNKVLNPTTNKHTTSSPSEPDLSVYRTFAKPNAVGDLIAADRVVRVRFDLASSAYDHADVYLYDQFQQPFKDSAGNDVEIILTTDSVRGGLFVDIPLRLVATHIQRDPLHSGGPGPNGEPVLKAKFTLKVAIWITPTIHKGNWSAPLEVEDLATPNYELSTLQDTPENSLKRQIENAVFSQIRRQFYLPNYSDWHVLLASTAHTGRANNALDFNMLNDDGKPVVAPFEGDVIFNEKDTGGNSTLVIQHKVNINGVDYFWYTELLHMQVDALGRTIYEKSDGRRDALAVGTHVSTGDNIGFCSNVSDSSIDSHVHHATRTDYRSTPIENNSRAFYLMPSIDQRNLLANSAGDSLPGFGMKFKAQSWVFAPTEQNPGRFVQNGDELFVRWVNDAWVNDEQAAGMQPFDNLTYARNEVRWIRGGEESAGVQSQWLATGPIAQSGETKSAPVLRQSRSGFAVLIWVASIEGVEYRWDGNQFQIL